MKDRRRENPIIIWKKQISNLIKKNPGKEIIMERRSMWSRLLAVVLAVSMVFSSQSMSVFADVVGQITTYGDDANTSGDQQDGQDPQNNEETTPSEGESEEGESQQGGSGEGTDEGQNALIQMTGTINADDVNLRPEPNTDGEPLSKLQEGDGVSILSEVTGTDGTSQWYEVLYGTESAYVSAEYVTVNEVVESESESETTGEVVEEEAAENGLMSDGDDVADNSTVAERVLAQAEQYYGEGTENPVTVATLLVRRTDSLGAQIKAGQVLSFSLEYVLNQARNFSYSGREQSMYDTYDDTKIYITLPAGLSIQSSNLNWATVSGSSTTGQWVLTLNDSSIGATSSSSGEYTFNVLVEGNGTLEVGHEFALSDNSLIQASIETNFTVLDKSDAGNGAELKTYQKRYNSSTNGDISGVTSVSDDEWAISKTATGFGQPYYDETRDEMVVAANFSLQVGFKNPAYENDNSLAKVLSDANNYAVPGRTTFSTSNRINLTESLTLTDRDKNPVAPISVTVTPQFGNEDPITFDNGETVEVPVDTCAGKNLSGTTVDGRAPYYSTYTVSAVYPYDVFIANWNEPDKQDDLTVYNTASISYLLNGETGTPHTDSDSANQSLGTVNNPVALTIQKNIRMYDGATTRTYASNSNWNWGMISGNAVFEIEKVDGDTVSDAVLYTRSGNTYTRLTGNTVAINPVETTGDYALTSTNGSVTVYLEEGTYRVTEVGNPENTAFYSVEGTGVTEVEDENAGECTLSGNTTSATMTFTNEASVGRIVVQKNGTANGSTSGLGGATFTLYSDEGATEVVKDAAGNDVTGTTNSSGQLTFNGLAVTGDSTTYYLKETSAPAGYVLSDTIYEVAVPKNGTTDTVEATNVQNRAYVKLQKQIEQYVGNKYQFVNVDSTTKSIFNGAFTLQQSTDNGKTWTNVTGFVNQGLDDSGAYAPANSLPVYVTDTDGSITATILYCFKEDLPGDWHGPNEDTDGNAYTDSFNLISVIGKGRADAYTVTMQNTQNAAITLTKKFVTMGTDGKQSTVSANNSTLTASFTLYKKVGEKGDLTAVGDAVATNANGQISFTNLAVREQVNTGNGTTDETVYYYLVETAKEGYDLQLGSSDSSGLAVTTIDGKQAIGPISFAGSNNLQTSVTAYNVEQKIPVRIIKRDPISDSTVSGAVFSVVVNYTEPDAEGKTSVSYTNVAAGAVLLLDAERAPITSVVVTETKAPDGYQKEDSSISYTEEFSNIDTVGQSQNVIALEFENLPYRKVTIQKTVEGTAVGTNNQVTFEVYVKNSNGTFSPATYPDSSKTLTLTSGSTLRLPAGTYYLHEVMTNNPNKVLDPDEFYEKYTGKGEYDTTSGKFYFGPYTVGEPDSEMKETDVTDWGTIDNISSEGSVTITKLDGVTDNTLGGATIQIYHYEGTQKKVDGTATTAGNGDAKGTVTFNNLPVYDSDGNKITYYITETGVPNGYYISKDTEKDAQNNDCHLSTTLVEGETITKVNGISTGDDLEIVNYPKRDFQVTKVARDLWEHQFTGIDQNVSGAVIALYKADTVDGTYTLVGEPKTTGDTGQVSWEDLEDGYYVAVEVSCPDVNGKETTPAVVNDQGNIVTKEFLGTAPQTLAASDLEKYNYVRLKDNSDTQATLLNVIGWTQLKIEKVDSENPAEKLNGSIFQLYKYVVPEGTKDTALSFQEIQATDADSLTLIGTYSSGTLSDAEGNILKGQFATDILEAGENIVYWLVETEATPGYSIIPEYEYILFKYPGTDYTNISSGGIATLDSEYVLNGVPKESFQILNKQEIGEGTDRFAYIRLYKWAETGDKENPSYKALGGVKYDLYLAGQDRTLYQKLDEMTTGLESTAVGGGTLTGMAMSNRLDYKDYTKYVDDDNTQNIAWWENDNKTGDFYVRMALVETYAPFGYQVDATPHYLIVCFSDEAVIVYDETYFVSSADGDAAPLASSLNGYPEIGTETSYRLTNKRQDYYSVTVQKYGYTPTASTTNKTSADLDQMRTAGTLQTTRLAVTMRLERKDGDDWKYYNYNTNQFTNTASEAQFTTTGGQYTFPNGLMEGEYRLIEVSGPDDYELLYNSATYARYFEVTGQGTTVTMYNPTKLSLSLKKTDWAGNAITSGVSFTLGTTTKSVSADGTVEFTNLASGTYKLTETASGYSTAYLTQYFTQEYPKAVALVNGTGLYFGYEKSQTDDGEDVTITAIKDPASYGLTGTVTVKDPELVELTLNKKNRDENQNGGNDLITAAATFEVYYQAFDPQRVAEGGTTVRKHTVKDMSSGNRTLIGTYSTTNGTKTIEDLNPGVYYIVEIGAPSGYENDSTPQYVALTGGMDITVDFSAVIPEGGTTPETETDSATLDFLDTPLGSLEVTKAVNWGDLDAETAYSFTFRLYDADGTQVGSAQTVNQGKLTATFTGLERGETYYLEEASANGYALSSVKQGQSTITADADHNNRYPVIIRTTDQTDNVEVTVNNTYQYAQFTFLKIDGTDGSKLSGAEFEIRKVEGTGEETQETAVTGADWTDNEDGSYTVKLPVSEEGTYRIYETEAPSGDYLLNKDQYIEVTLTPGADVRTADGWTWTSGTSDKALLNAYVMPNYKGAFIEVTKYDNMKEAEELENEEARPAVLAGAGFTLYAREAGSEGQWTVYSQEATTGDDGKVRFTVNRGYEYAIGETTVPGGYSGLQGIWSGDQKITSTDTLDDETIYILGSDWTLGETYSFSAYNIPSNLELEIRKIDADDQNNPPKATVSVYEVPDTTSETLTEQQISDLMVSSNAFVTGVQTSQTAVSASNVTYSYADKTVNAKLGELEAGKTYLIVETSVTTMSNGAYAMTLDDPRVVWYKVLNVPAGTKEKQVVTLINVKEEVSLAISKTATVIRESESEGDSGDIAATATLPSLFEEGQVIEYTITPTVTNGFALDTFTIDDTGLKAYNGKNEIEGALDGKYTITSMSIGAASYNAEDFGYTAAQNIQATVTFKDFEGNQVGEAQTVSVSSGAANVTVPNVEGTKIASFTISYEDTAFENATGYVLGKDFKPGAVTFRVDLEKQDGGSSVTEITSVKNFANAAMTYRGWETPTSRNSVDANTDISVETTFGTLEIPVVTVAKDAEEDQEVRLGDDTHYTLTLNNVSPVDDSGKGTAFQQPVLVDVLPQGTSVDTTAAYAEIIGDNPSGLTISQRRLVTFGTNTAVLLYFDGELEAGDSVQVRMTVKTSQSTAIYGNTMRNAVFASSAKPGVVTEENSIGASFKGQTSTDITSWAESLSSVATGIIGADRTLALTTALEDERLYGFISAHDELIWDTSSTLTLSKSNYGSEDEAGSYRSDRLARTTDGGAVYYQLAVTNTNQTMARTNMTLMDVIPRVGDMEDSTGASRGSQWPLYFDSITSVTVGGTAVTDYDVYYYVVENEDSIVSASAFDAVKNAQDGCPQGWTTDKPSDPAQIGAFIINLKDASLAPGENVIVQYTTKVKDYTPEGVYDTDILEALLDEYREAGYTNAVNNFSFYYDSYQASNDPEEDAENKKNAYSASSQLVSNVVSATMIPGKVKVGGHVWIDANADGIWDLTNEATSIFSQYDIVQDLLDNIQVTLFKYNDKTSGTEDLTSSGTETYDQTADTAWYTNANFIFTGLDPAYPLGESPLYSGNQLNVGDLKGDSPATYILQATLSAEIAGKFDLTTSSGTYVSQDPANIPPVDRTDNNFVGDSASSNSERFYLWQTSTDDSWDNTKDIGFTLRRDLTIEKTAADNTDTKVDGATFEIYGPFNRGEAAKQNIDTLIANKDAEDSKLVYSDTTANGGTLTVNDLLWFQEYIIVETSAGTGYTLTDADADVTNGTLTAVEGKEGAWILNIPNTTFTGTSQKVSVDNVRETEATFTATKTLNGRDATTNDSFTFELLNSDRTSVLDTKTITGTVDEETGTVTLPTVSFDSVTLRGVGTFTYYIREQIPTDAKNNVKDGISYDTKIYQVQVTTTWDATNNRLVAGTPVYKVYNETDGTTTGNDVGTASFSNTYTASGNWKPEATKTLIGRDMKEGETYTFSVREIPANTDYSKEALNTYEEVATGTVSGGTDGTAKAITFTKVEYDLSDLGIHTYAIYEINGTGIGGNANGVTYSDKVILVTVTVTDDGDGTLTATPDYGQPDLNFSNVYAASTTASLDAAKKVTGGSIKSGFEFYVYTDEDLSTLDTTHVTIKDQTENANEVTNPVTNTNGTIHFTFKFSQDDLKDVTGAYPKSKDVVFYIKEAASESTGYRGSSEVYELTYTVTDDGNGTLTAARKSIRYKASESAEWSSSLPEDYGSTITFTNTYAATGKAQVVAQKILNGRGTPLEADEFEFVLTALNGAPLDENVTYVVGNAADGSITFPEINYDMDDLAVTEAGVTTYPEKTFKYLLTETPGSDTDHYIYDGTEYEVWITVSDNGNGTLNTSASYKERVYEEGSTTEYTSEDAMLTTIGEGESQQSVPAFTNQYTIEGSLLFSGRKLLTEQTIQAGQFSFILTSEADGTAEQDADNLAENAGIVNLIQQVSVEAGGNFSFNALNYDQDDVGHTYHYTMYEAEKTDTNYTYDETRYEFNVRVYDNGGTLKMEVMDMTEYPEGTPNNERAQIADSHTSVTVSFTNHYTAEGGLTLQAIKTVENREEPVAKDEFTIDVYEVDRTTENLGTTIVASGTTAAGTEEAKDGSVTINFGDEYYKITSGMSAEQRDQVLGTHTYILRERIPAGAVQKQDGKIVYDEMVYSKTAYKVIVNVTDNRDGTLKAEVTSRSKLTVSDSEYWKETGTALQKDDTMEFTNTYLADGNTTITLNKTLTGSRKDGIGAGEFTFQAQKVDTIGGEPEEDARTYTGTTAAASADKPYETTAEITIPFDQDDLGENIYKLTESATTADSVDTSNAVYYVVFTVQDANNHNLEAADIIYYKWDAETEAWVKMGSDETREFVNAYRATGTITLTGEKELTGNRRQPLQNGEFTFEIVDGNGDVVSTGTNDDSGKITFSAIDPYPDDDQVNTYTEADIGKTYTYTIREVDKENDAVSVETDPIQIQIKVEDGDGKGKLSVTLTGDVTEEDISFTNHYNASGNDAFEADKILEGGRGTDIADDEFKFVAQLVSADADQQATYNGSYDAETKKVVFDTMTFDEDDIGRTYTYRISETEGSDDSIEYSKEVFYATVSIEDSGEIGADGNGILTTTVKYYEDPECVNELTNGITFTNQYLATGRVELEATKILDGRPLGAGEFIFGIYEITEDQDGKEVRTQILDADGNPLYAFNDADGNIKFDPITYDQDDQGIHNYEIVEFIGRAESIKYDQEPVKVSVEVKDEFGNGQLTVTETYESGEGAHTEFTNYYNAEGEVTFTGLKRMLGNRAMEIQEGEFTFTVTENGNEVATGKTLDGGIIEFTTIEYDERDVGTHTYVISENMGKDESVSYTAPDVTVNVEVTDNTDGTLTAVPTYPEGGVVFENQYYAQGEITLTGTKELLGNRGNGLTDGEFQFEVRELDENGNPGEEPIAYGQNNADGSISFDTITYLVEEGRSDIGVHEYVITETAGQDATIDYADDSFYVTVNVTDFGRGTLEAEVVAEESDGVLFQNNYRASGELILDNFSKVLSQSPLAEGQFQFTLADEDGNVLQTVSNDADGRIVFDALTYDESDIGQTYTYQVAEVNNNVTGVTYDNTVYTVAVSIADSEDSDGTLVITPVILNGDQEVTGEEGTLPAVTFENSFQGSVTLNKVNEAGAALAGATFQLYARTEGTDTYEVYATEGNQEGLYTTDVNGQIQVTGLAANDYYFIETEAPQGYVIETDEEGQPRHYTFTIGVQDGTAGIVENGVVNAELTVTNPGATSGSIQVTKRVSRIDDNFDIVDFTAVNETYYVGLFTDAAGTQPYGTDYIRTIQMNGVSVSEPVTYSGLPSGTYYVLETDAEGNPIQLNETQTLAGGGSYYCIVENNGSNAVTLDLTTSEVPGAVNLQNIYLELPPDGYYWDATIDITKRVLKNGEEATADDTFYAGVYQMLEDGSYELLTEVELEQNGTVTVTGLGGPIGESMTYYVFETDGNGNRVSEDPAFLYAVSGEGSVTVTQDNTAGSITITNEYEEEKPTEKPTEEPSEKPTEPTTKPANTNNTEPTTTTSTKATKTGDTTDLTVELLLLVLAAVIMGTSIYARKRRRNRR